MFAAGAVVPRVVRRVHGDSGFTKFVAAFAYAFGCFVASARRVRHPMSIP